MTSQAVIELQQDLTGRLAIRGVVEHHPAAVGQVGTALARLDAARSEPLLLDEGQVAAVRAIAGTGPLVFIEGAVGAGKTSMLATAHEVIHAQGRHLRVVAPTKKAADVAAAQISAASSTTAGLAYSQGFRWDSDGVWSRLAIGDTDASGFTYTGPGEGDRLNRGDVLVIDEAGMLDQQTARALLHIADEAGANLVYVEHRRQLPAVGIGGVLDMVSTWSPQHLELACVHRFRKNVIAGDGELANVPETQYAALSLEMRAGLDPSAVFDQLLAQGHGQLWGGDAEAFANLALSVVERRIAGQSHVISVATNDEAALINEAVHQQLVERGHVDTSVTVNGSDGLQIGVGDEGMTRQNQPHINVANRQVWTVTAITPDGHVQVAGRNREQVTLPPDYVQKSLRLAYATTTDGVQGETATHSDLLLTSCTDAASAYVGMTRGRHSNTVHSIADTPEQARDQWVEAASRHRADLGLDHARRTALGEARNYRQRGADPLEALAPNTSAPNESDRVSHLRGLVAAAAGGSALL